MVKALAGGGGRGIRHVCDPAVLAEAIEAVARILRQRLEVGSGLAAHLVEDRPEPCRRTEGVQPPDTADDAVLDQVLDQIGAMPGVRASESLIHLSTKIDRAV